jgi:ribosome biogenesis SPOUT family RNA methylase Rps3
MSDSTIKSALDKLGEVLEELANIAREFGAKETVVVGCEKKAASKKKAKAKAKAESKSKKDGPSIDDARVVCLELVETVDEHSEGEDGNEVLKGILNVIFDDCSKLSDVENLEDSGDRFRSIIDAVKGYLAENYEEEN